MSSLSASAEAAPSFCQPKPVIRWLAVALAVAGWYVSLQLLRISSGAGVADPLLHAVCGPSREGQADGCTSVLTSPQAYVPMGKDPDAPRMPVSAFGMAYFALVALWYLLVGPPARAGRRWHLLIAAVVAAGAYQSAGYVRIMAWELHRWCGGCLAVHAINAGLLLLTALAYPWRAAAKPGIPHPSARLALAALTAGLLAAITHLAAAYVGLAGSILRDRTARYAAVLSDPDFIIWDFHRQAAVDVPVREDEPWAGSPVAPNTVIVFSDYQCPHCRQAHETLQKVLENHPGQVRVLQRHYPQDPACNSNPKYRSGGHPSACRAARAVEAARLVGGPEAAVAMHNLLYARRDELPTVPLARQNQRQRRLFEDWAVELGLDRTAFTQAMESAEVTARLLADIELADKLGIDSIPVVYLNGRRLRNWSRLDIWDAILRSTSRPTSSPQPP